MRSSRVMGLVELSRVELRGDVEVSGVSMASGERVVIRERF